ncbi:MAG: adenylyltransferase/cytidyltransferase family protein [bacterium]
MRLPKTKILTWDDVKTWRAAVRQAGRRLVLTNGCFDLLHRGHVDYLARARQLGDALLLAVNSDASIRTLKGPERPLNPEDDRLFVLAGLESVDAVVIFDSLRADGIIALAEPDFYAKGGDISLATLPPEERHALNACGAQIIFLPFLDGFSSTATINKARQNQSA